MCVYLSSKLPFLEKDFVLFWNYLKLNPFKTLSRTVHAFGKGRGCWTWSNAKFVNIARYDEMYPKKSLEWQNCLIWSNPYLYDDAKVGAGNTGFVLADSIPFMHDQVLSKCNLWLVNFNVERVQLWSIW